MNNSENQVIDININNNAKSLDNDNTPSNANGLINNQNNQDTYKDWCEEDGDFEVEEVVQQQGDHHESQLLPSPPSQQPSQLELIDNGGNFDFDDEMINSGQVSSLNNDQTADNVVVEFQKQNNEQDIEALHSSTTKITHEDDTLHFNEDLDNMMTDEIGKTNIGNLCAAQNSEVPVQSVWIDQKDVVTLEDEIIKSQSPEKVQKSKQSPQKGKQRKGSKKTKVDTEIIQSSAAEISKSTPIKFNNDQCDDQNDQLGDSENDPKTKSGRKVQRPEYFTPTVFVRGRRKSSFELANESSRRTKRQTGKRQSRSGKTTRKDMSVLQDSEILSSDLNNQTMMYEDIDDDNIVCTVCNDGISAGTNQIVLCDKCDAPYHQRCHKPRIDDIVTEDSQIEWICSKCRTLPRLSKRIKIDKKIPETQEIHEDKEQSQELISIGAVLTREQKVEYLSSLSQDVLVNLLLLAEQMEPNIPLYPASILGRYATANMSSRDNEMDETNQSIQDTGECLAVDVQTSGLSTAEMSNLSTLEISPNLNPVNIEKVPLLNPEQDTQQEPITPESPPSNNLKEITEHSKDSYLSLYIKAMSEIGNPNGSTAQTMHSWIKGNYNVPENFTARAKKALHYAVNKGIFIKNSRMTYKFNPDYAFKLANTNVPTTEDAVKNIVVNINNNYDAQKPTYKEITQSGEEISGIGKQNSSSDMKDFNFYPNNEFYLDSMLDANLAGKGDDAYTTTTHSQRSSLSNSVNNNAENNNNNNVNVSIAEQYNQTSLSDKQQQSQQISSVQKHQVNTQMIINNEQNRTSDIRLPPLAPKPPINVLPSIMRSNSISYQPSQQRITNHQTELLASSIGGGVPIIRGPSDQLQPPPSQQVYDNTKIRTPSSSIPSLQSLPAIDTSLNGNVNKIRTQQMIPLQSSTIHNTATTIPTSPQQPWPSSFNPFYMSPQPGDAQFTTIFENAFYDPNPQPPQHHQHPSTTSTNDYNNVVINDLQHHHNDNNSLFHRMSGNQQQDNNILGEWDYRNV